MENCYLIDPPEGHQFGFPKIFVGEIRGADIDSWLVEHGYPRDRLTAYPEGVPCKVQRIEVTNSTLK